MAEEVQSASVSVLEMTSEIVAAYVSGNKVSAGELPTLIASVFGALTSAGTNGAVTSAAPALEKPTAAQIRKSIKPDGLVSFEDGRTYKTLKRHLSRHGLTIAEYKAKWGLPNDYPTTAPDYSARRSEMAKRLGLGKKGAKAGEPAQKAAAPRGRRKGGA